MGGRIRSAAAEPTAPHQDDGGGGAGSDGGAPGRAPRSGGGTDATAGGGGAAPVRRPSAGRPPAGDAAGGGAQQAGAAQGHEAGGGWGQDGAAQGLAPHQPVLLEAALAFLAPRRGGRYVDGTVGGGGHAAALLAAVGGDAQLLAIDRDPQALAVARRRLAPFGDRVHLVHGDFRDLERHLASLGWDRVDGILLDLGVSSMQLDDPSRGFSYQEEGPLDMRMDPGQPLTAADLVNTASRDQLARWLAEYGEERWAGRIADFIVEARRRRPITTTTELVEIVKAAIPARARRRGGHPARRTFQALRIAVNDELRGLEGFLRAAAQRLRPGGRLVVIAFHSLEDRAVKRAFRDLAAGEGFRLLTRKPVTPGEEEVRRNPRSRSAKLRALQRLAAGPAPAGGEPRTGAGARASPCDATR
ncbi:16S rRNA (cytosine(1402)-N(4))-methyltransferase RsmH [Thermaerobacter sp. FW80]|uniref:16S rRNA (cytosine(1402)-N(4))-methyltransferase RsmH n=1 Tax=Thermaerobacter sp. FW80 TaxID=2546351 RepID=UPI001FAAC395|nr:16S rRNA (cytosine(1402)-N(4))-methyltransferase RsmH [Thermaerobacter sp. FW80]